MTPPALAAFCASDQYGHMTTGRVVLRRVLRGCPGSMRALAREAGVSHGLLMAVRGGERRLTAATRGAVVQALRRWSGTCAALADELEAAELEPGGRDGEA
jgi:hypothetical protein